MQLINIVAILALGISLVSVIFMVGFSVGYQYCKIRVTKSIEKTTEETRKVQYSAIDVKKLRKDVPEFTQIIGGLRYKSLDAKCIAQGGSLMGGWTWLMQTNSDKFFFLVLTFGLYNIIPLDKTMAIHSFTTAAIKEVKFEDAFPDVEVKDV